MINLKKYIQNTNAVLGIGCSVPTVKDALGFEWTLYKRLQKLEKLEKGESRVSNVSVKDTRSLADKGFWALHA